jgi:uncharacterized protein (DUF1778 family)
MPHDNQPAKKNKERLIAFRVDDDSYNELENRAALAGKTVNDWCRDEVLARLTDASPLTANEQLIHSELVIFGSALVHYFDLVATKQLTPQTNNELKEWFARERREAYQEYFTTRREGK